MKLMHAFYSYQAHIYDAPTDTWTQVTNTNYGRMWGSIATFKSHIYAFGGYTYGLGDTKFVEEYDPVMNKW
jgi:hypothetical protein